MTVHAVAVRAAFAGREPGWQQDVAARCEGGCVCDGGPPDSSALDPI